MRAARSQHETIAKISAGRLDTSDAEEAWEASKARLPGGSKAHEVQVEASVEEWRAVIDNTEEGE